MAVISVIITESEEQVVAGIPRNVSISTNVSSSIFYTLDGSEPTLFSNMYVGVIRMPTNLLSVTLKVFATNGVDSSPVISDTYQTNMLNNARLPHSATDTQPGQVFPALYPFGTPPLQPNGVYLNPGDAGITVDNPTLPQIPSGYDADGYPTGFTNQPYNLENYSIRYSKNDSLGQMGPNIGNLPAQVIIQNAPPEPEETEQFSNIFDPRAYVIFQDFSLQNPDDPQHINRMFFTLQNPEKARDGNAFYTAGLDSPPTNGTFLKSYYNPRDNTMTYYYIDTWTNKWIISKDPYYPTGNYDGNLSGVRDDREPGSKYVFQWLPFTRRVLF